MKERDGEMEIIQRFISRATWSGTGGEDAQGKLPIEGFSSAYPLNSIGAVCVHRPGVQQTVAIHSESQEPNHAKPSDVTQITSIDVRCPRLLFLKMAAGPRQGGGGPALYPCMKPTGPVKNISSFLLPLGSRCMPCHLKCGTAIMSSCCG
jgi:hypothetical protein